MIRGRVSRFHDDDAGAVMMTGLFMCLFLIGALWYVIGVGDAVVHRDTMQEAADHAAFTSASLHAKGMNLIAACNLVLLVLTAIHLILGIIHDVLLVVCVVSAIFTGGGSCAPWQTASRIWQGYFTVFTGVARATHYVELAAAYGYPIIGTVQALKIGGEDYRALTPTFSTSLLPGAALSGPINAIGGRDTGDGRRNVVDPGENKKGLPVKGESNDYLCTKIGREIVNAIAGAGNLGESGGGAVSRRLIGSLVGGQLNGLYCRVGVNQVIGTLLDRVGLGLAADLAGDAIGELLEGARLRPSVPDVGGKSFWESEGPLVPWGGGENGNPWYQVWSWSWKTGDNRLVDTSERRIGIASRQRLEDTSPATVRYFAQAEFYFDCQETWGHVSCNGRAGEDNAGFAIKWRARLRRYDGAAIGTLVATGAWELLRSNQFYRELKSSLNSVLPGDLGKQLFREVESLTRRELVVPLGQSFDGPRPSGVYH